MHFTFVGNIDVNKFKPLAETYLASLPSSQKENKFTDEGMRPVKGVVETTVAKGAAKQSMVNIIFTGENGVAESDALKINMLAEVLNIKIIEQLREEMSGIYGGGSSGSIAKRPYKNYTFSIRFPCGPENVEKLNKALFEILNTIQTKGIEQKDLDKVKETLKKQNEDAMKENDYWLESLTSTWINNENPLKILDFAKRVDALTVKDIQDAANKYWNMKNYIKAVLNPEK